MNIACIYFVTNISESICTLNRLQEMCEEKNIDLFIYQQQVVENFPETDDENFDYEINDNVIKFSFRYLKELFNWRYNDGVGSHGSKFLTLLDFFKNLYNSYDYYIFYDAKIGYFNDINLFDYFDFENSDAIFEDYRVIVDGYKYAETLGINTEIYLRYDGKCNLYALSKNVLNYIVNFLNINTELYCQDTYLINTLCMTDDLFNLSYLCNYLTIESKERNLDFSERYYDIKYPIEEQYDLNYFSYNVNKYDNVLRYGEEPEPEEIEEIEE